MSEAVKNALLSASVLASVFATAACSRTAIEASSSPASAPSATEPAGERVYLPHGSVLKASLWKFADNLQSKPIKVCWENPSVDDATWREIVRQSVAETWSAVTPLDFIGWEKCPDGEFKGIRIIIEDVGPNNGPHVKALGRFLSNRRNGMSLNFDFNNWSAECSVDDATRKFCLWAVAVHEFGHAIGFAHEQNRTDAPPQCKADHHSGTTGDWNLGEYDPKSIMNYCNKEWNNKGALSDRDIEASQQIYGKRPA